jgi:hypothetical protein
MVSSKMLGCEGEQDSSSRVDSNGSYEMWMWVEGMTCLGPRSENRRWRGNLNVPLEHEH